MSKKIKILFDPADRERLEPILAALRDGGVGVSELGGEPAKDEIVLAAEKAGYRVLSTRDSEDWSALLVALR